MEVKLNMDATQKRISHFMPKIHEQPEALETPSFPRLNKDCLIYR